MQPQLAQPFPQPPSWSETFRRSLRDSTTTWLVTAVVTLLGVFSGSLADHVKTALNRADLRTRNYESLAIDVSAFVSIAEWNVEFLEHGWTTKGGLGSLLTDYNQSITSIRKNEWVYRSWLHRYWNNARLDEFEDVMKAVRDYDQSLHDLNDEFGRVYLKEKVDPTEKLNPAAVAPVLPKLKTLLPTLQQRASALLLDLQ